jgi:DNA mismatch repair protein MutS2
MYCYPQQAFEHLEFDKIKEWLGQYCRTEKAKNLAQRLQPSIQFTEIELYTNQSLECKNLLDTGFSIPNNFATPLAKELKLLGIAGANLPADVILQFKKLALNTEAIFRWFNAERRQAFPHLTKIIQNTYYEKAIAILISEVLEDNGAIKDDASPDLKKIRQNLYRKRNEQRRLFMRILSQLQKKGYLADIEESFMNGRRVIAIQSEQKRQIKGILHGESESRKTTFLEPEETIEINNEVYTLEYEESKEIQKILRDLTKQLQAHSALLNAYYSINGILDFVEAKAKLARDYNGIMPELDKNSSLHLIHARHPLLLRYNNLQQKPTIPFSIELNPQKRILVISGPNAGGKTVTLKTIGLLQVMLQSGLLIPAAPGSQMGIFKKLLIHIGDTQSIEFELSTYSSHLKAMKNFLEEANGRTLFMIDELGGGTDPNLGGAFAEVILEELAKRHSVGIVTTHYLNLKIMANRTSGIINGAMAFDEKNLLPLYQLTVGKPGSSYTFAIAQRIGFKPEWIQAAKDKVQEEHFKLDKLLNRTEQDLKQVTRKEKELNDLLKHNQQQKKQLDDQVKKEKHAQQIELLKHQNKIKEEQLVQLKEMDRKLKAIMNEWRKAKDKKEGFTLIDNLLFNKKKEQKTTNKLAKKLDAKFEEIKEAITVGSQAKFIKNHQVGQIVAIKGKIATIKIGLLPMQVPITELIAVKEKKAES